MQRTRDLDALTALLSARAQWPFEWGRQDCARFAFAAVEAQIGRNLIKGLRWRSQKTALAVAGRWGGLELAMDAHLERIPPAMAMRGDVAGIPDPVFGVRLMVVEGRHLIGPGQNGLRVLPRSAMVMAWSAVHPVCEAS